MDINECSSTPSPCGTADCTNTVGDYNCSCSTGTLQQQPTSFFDDFSSGSLSGYSSTGTATIVAQRLCDNAHSSVMRPVGGLPVTIDFTFYGETTEDFEAYGGVGNGTHVLIAGIGNKLVQAIVASSAGLGAQLDSGTTINSLQAGTGYSVSLRIRANPTSDGIVLDYMLKLDDTILYEKADLEYKPFKVTSSGVVLGRAVSTCIDDLMINSTEKACVGSPTGCNGLNSTTGPTNGNAEIGRAVQQECRDRSRMPSSA
eukprot:TRINITY_DN5679_c0_g1_i14.p1 TRINITY_DN5679_c0_g1~~TRINITY_DN5679_c0_g1_i14.p1  ORF type:complete len:258 (+),score=52.35 TRINITY_DN5679_c0_g1_i14:125-898(+)